MQSHVPSTVLGSASLWNLSPVQVESQPLESSLRSVLGTTNFNTYRVTLVSAHTHRERERERVRARAHKSVHKSNRSDLLFPQSSSKEDYHSCCEILLPPSLSHVPQQSRPAILSSLSSKCIQSDHLLPPLPAPTVVHLEFSSTPSPPPPF